MIEMPCIQCVFIFFSLQTKYLLTHARRNDILTAGMRPQWGPLLQRYFLVFKALRGRNTNIQTG